MRALGIRSRRADAEFGGAGVDLGKCPDSGG